MSTTPTILSPEEHAVLVAKVERLWRKARSTDYPAEREAFEAKALYLMARARITEAMLDLHGDTSDGIVDVEIGDELSGGYRIPAETIFQAVCNAFGCRAYLFVRGRRSQPAAVGFASDIDRVRFLWPLLLTDSLAAATQLKGRTAAVTTALRRSSMFGYAEAITERFEAINRLAEEDSDRDGDTAGRVAVGAPSTAALVVRSRREQVDDAFSSLRISRRTRRASAGSGGYGHGRAAGLAADLTGGRHTVSGRRGELAR